MATHSSILAWKIQGQRSLVGYSPLGCKELDTIEAKKYRYVYILINKNVGFPGDSVVKNPPVNAEDLSSIPGLRRSPGGEHDKPLQYSYLENSHEQRCLVGHSPWGRKESGTTE